MKLSSIFVGALATVVAAAPAKVEEEKRSFDSSFSGFGGDFGGDFGGGFDSFNVGVQAFGLAPVAVGFGLAAVQGNIFNPGLATAFNNFNLLNSNVAFLLGANNFNINSFLTFLDLGFAGNGIAQLFNFGAGNVLDVQTLLNVNNLLVMQWLLNQFGNELFFQGFGGFGGIQLPAIDFSLLAGAGLGLNSQFAIDQSLIDINAFDQVANPFLGNFGQDAFNNFNFVNLKNSGAFLKE